MLQHKLPFLIYLFSNGLVNTIHRTVPDKAIAIQESVVKVQPNNLEKYAIAYDEIALPT